MTPEDIIKQLPQRYIAPIDGMSVTAEVWAEAHDHHRERLRLHNLTQHGSGILSGLNVVASDPADSQVYILPGVALDPMGQLIIVSEPIVYDIGDNTSGTIHILLGHSESNPRPDETRVQEEGAPLYRFDQYSLDALVGLPDGPAVELARIRRNNPRTPITNAANLDQPAHNELDLRFRPHLDLNSPPIISMGLCYLGNMTDVKHSRGLGMLSSALSHNEIYLARADYDLSLDIDVEDLKTYSLIYLVAQDQFQFQTHEMNLLYAYLNAGGTIFIESCRRNIRQGAGPADEVLLDMLNSLGIRLEVPPSTHPLMTTPHFFPVPPAGFETEGQPSIQVGDGVIFSTCDYGCIWQGERRSGPATREEVRSAYEWGANLIRYALNRHEDNHS